MLGDKAYDSAELREELDELGARPVIPNRSNRKKPFNFSKRLYKLRWRIESAFSRLRRTRGTAWRGRRQDRRIHPSPPLHVSAVHRSMHLRKKIAGVQIILTITAHAPTDRPSSQ